MYKCKNCGTDFEGVFCPKCGWRWSDTKACPQCGSKQSIGAIYCTECSYSFVSAKESPKEMPDTMPDTTAAIPDPTPNEVHQCINCGKEFVGKYCPECGSKWSKEKNCPKCGTKLGGGVKYCTECGYAFVTPNKVFKEQTSFKQKLSAIWKWIKSHLKIVVPTTMLAVFAIIMLSLIPTFILASVNGTYYASSSDGTLHEDIYITLSTGKWKTSAGTAGEYKVNGKQITLIYHDKDAEAIFGKDSELAVQKTFGSVQNKVLIIGGSGDSVAHYRKKDHKHKYINVVTINEPTCTVNGTEAKTCACGYQRTEVVSAKGHDYRGSITQEATCGVNGTWTDVCVRCGNKSVKTIPSTGNHTVMHGICTVCKQYQLAYSQYYNLGYRGYTVKGFAEGFSQVASVEIVGTYNNFPVTNIGNKAFAWCANLKYIIVGENVTVIEDEAFFSSVLTSITMTNNVTSIGEYAFAHCKQLTDIHFEGTQQEWNAIMKGSDWDLGMPTYTVHCTDGDIVVNK